MKSGSKLLGGWAGQWSASSHMYSLRVSHHPSFICPLDKLPVENYHLSAALILLYLSLYWQSNESLEAIF